MSLKKELNNEELEKVDGGNRFPEKDKVKKTDALKQLNEINAAAEQTDSDL